jgi:hypothetical protein
VKPAFIGLGAQRSGTSWIYACLYEHPQLYMPHKEINFFARDHRYAWGLDWYERHFDGCSEGQLPGEYSTTYLDSADAPKRIHDFAPDAKLIMVVRDPAERASSNYRNDIMAGSVGASTPFQTGLADHPEWVERGLYHKHLTRYLEYFDRSQILVLVYDDAVSDPEAYIKSIFAFLGVDDSFRPMHLLRKVNPGRQPRSVSLDLKLDSLAQFMRDKGLHRLVWLAKRFGVTAFARRLNTEAGEAPNALPVDRAGLQSAYVDDIHALESLLGRDLSGWLEAPTTAERVSSSRLP